jgi:hypothetical protein
VAETDQPVVRLAAGREQDHRHPLARALVKAPHHLDPVEPRQHQVEDEEIRTVEIGLAQRLRPVRRLEGLEAGPLEVAGDDLDDRRLVVDDEDAAVAGLGHCRDSRPWGGASQR